MGHGERGGSGGDGGGEGLVVERFEVEAEKER